MSNIGIFGPPRPLHSEDHDPSPLLHCFYHVLCSSHALWIPSGGYGGGGVVGVITSPPLWLKILCVQIVIFRRQGRSPQITPPPPCGRHPHPSENPVSAPDTACDFVYGWCEEILRTNPVWLWRYRQVHLWKFHDCTHSENMTVSIISLWDFVLIWF